jgi:hypothetical protein
MQYGEAGEAGGGQKGLFLAKWPQTNQALSIF